MHGNTRVFVSATSSDLSSVRQLVKEALLAMDCFPVEQSNFEPDYRTVEDALREKITSCQAVVHIVGLRYGTEPDPAQLPEGKHRRSYTQLEYDLARQLNKKVYVFLCPESFPFDACSPEPDELRVLQQRHRQMICSEGHLRNEVATPEVLGNKVRELRFELESLRAEVAHLRRRNLGCTFSIAITLLLLLAAVGYIGWSTHDQSLLAAKVAELYDNPGQLAERMRNGIRKTATGELEAARKRGATWEEIRELERRRDVALAQVDDLLRSIQAGLAEEPDPLFREASRILAAEGIDAAIGYLTSHQQGILARVELLGDQEAKARQEKRKALQPLLLQAELCESNLAWDQALKLYQMLAEKAPRWPRVRRQLGRLLDDLARFAEAEPHLVAALQFANDDAERSFAANSLGLFYLETSQWNLAEPLLEQSLELNQRLYGPDHHETAMALVNLALLLKNTNRLDESEQHYRRALRILEQAFGPDHPEVAVCLGNLALLLQELERFEEAEPLIRRALAIDEQAQPADPPVIAIRLGNLAELLADTKRYDEAEPLMLRALAIDEQVYGANHVQVARNLNNLAKLFTLSERPEEAEPLMRRVLTIVEQTYGNDHPVVAISLNNLTQLLRDTNRLDEAEPLGRRAVEILLKMKAETGYEPPNLRVLTSNYRELLNAMGLSEAEVARRLEEMAK